MRQDKDCSGKTGELGAQKLPHGFSFTPARIFILLGLDWRTTPYVFWRSTRSARNRSNTNK